MSKKKLLSVLLAASMVLSAVTPFAASASEDTDNGDGSFYNEELGYTYGTTFYSDEPITYTMFFNDNDAYPIKDSWQQDGGVFSEITKATNVTLDITVVNNASYSDKVTLAISSGDAPDIIPKMYSETAYVTGGGIVAVSDYVQYMPNYSYMVDTYDLQSEVDSLLQEDGKYYRLPGLKETCLQDYSLLIRDDIFQAAGYDVRDLEANWTWDDFVDILIDVKAYMVDQGMCSEDDYIWSDRWCGATSGYGQGGALLELMGMTYGIYSGWYITSNSAGLYFDWDDDEYKLSATSDQFKDYMTIVQKLVNEKILDPETWTQEDDTADGKFYRGETALISTNRSQYTAQKDGLASQLGEGNFEVYEIVIPMGNNDYQAEKERLECGICISSTAKNSMSEEEFIRLMRFVDWLWYSEAGLTLTKWGIEGETYTVDDDGNYSLTPGYYCGGLSIAQTSDDQVDMRLEYGYACGNFMYSGNKELLTSNFSDELKDFYNRMDEYRTLEQVDPPVAMSEDDQEMLNLWATPLSDTINTWTLKFAMGQADLDAEWDNFVAEVDAQNASNVVNMYNDYYQSSK